MMGSTTDLTAAHFQNGVASPRLARSRTQSISSDRPSTIGHSLLSPPLTVSPEPAFIASSAASQIVTNDHDSHADAWYDQHGLEPAGETALVSLGALGLVNNFLDQLLFNFLQVARATTLAALRPAVSEVLKPKLAKDAINNADEELREYLGGGDEDDYVQPQGADPSRDWDLELVWKRTRLRCMVYSSLGDMEEEDEDIYMEQENLELGADEQISDVISPAVAIFLTSVLEYMGEMTLTVAGQTAYHRMRVRFEKELKDGVRGPTDLADRIVVEDSDMERVALDRTLGRLWRGWKKRIRSPAIEASTRPFSLRNLSGHSRQASNASDILTPKPVLSDGAADGRKSQDAVEETIVEDVHPMDIPLPLGERDIDEIEVPGLAAHSDDEDDEEEELKTQRPQSMLFPPAIADAILSVGAHLDPRTLLRRTRSNSVPTRQSLPYSKWSQTNTAEEDPAAGEQKPRDEHGEHESADEDVFETPNAIEENGSSMPIDINTGKRLSKSADTSEDEDATIEKAEIMTSARVSVAGSSPSDSETGQIKRTSSVRSARIIDVPSRRSISGSRPTSIDAHHRARPASIEAVERAPSSLSNVSAPSSPAGFEEAPKIRAIEAVSQPTVVIPSSRSPVERMRQPIQNAATISESEEEEAEMEVSPLSERDEMLTPTASVPVASKNIAMYNNMTQAGQSSRRKSSLSRPDQTVSGTKVPPLSSYPQRVPITEETIPEIPRKAPGHTGRHNAKGDSIGLVSVQRSRTRTMDSDEIPPPPPQINASPRQTHTSGSSASSGTGRLKAVRTSEDHGANRAESVARNFEELIQSNQTITYTLTPENMRDPDALDSPVLPRFRKSEDAKAQTRSRSSSAATEVKGAPLVSKATAMGSHPLPENIVTKPASPATRMSGPRSPRLSGAMARDARVPMDSTADFAEFIKSTGPPGETRPVPVRNMNGASAANGANGPHSPTKSSSDMRRVSTNSNRMRYQPREAAIDTKSDNSDLIDFIRQGPPSAANNHRIPRHVAPFRNTMDSDQMAGGAGGGRAVDATIPEIRYSQASTNVTENSMPSMQSSANSSSALLKNRPSNAPSKFFDDEDMMPKRKTRRVRDPYAIDFSDEEEDEDEFIATPKPPPPKKEESLAEFLRNYQPPPEPAAPVISQRMPKKKSSAPSLMARFTRSQSGKDSHTPNVLMRSQSPIDSRSLNSRASGNGSGKGYIPIQVNMPSGYDKYGAIENGASRPRLRSTASASEKIPMKKFEPRDPVSNVTRTSELAAFLRDSEPPPSSTTPNALHSAMPEHSNGLSKMLGRRRKVFV